MPTARDEIREKFFTRNEQGHIIDDGIEKAEKLIADFGGKIIKNGFIDLSSKEDGTTIPEEVSEAIEYLCDEWDYAVKADKYVM